jgi:hypothetical protein
MRIFQRLLTKHHGLAVVVQRSFELGLVGDNRAHCVDVKLALRGQRTQRVDVTNEFAVDKIRVKEPLDDVARRTRVNRFRTGDQRVRSERVGLLFDGVEHEREPGL